MKNEIINHLIEGLQEDQLIEELQDDGEEIFAYGDSEWYISFFREKWVAWELIGLEQKNLGKIKFFDTEFEAVIDQLKLGIRLLGEDIDGYVYPPYNTSVLEVAKEIFERESEGEEIDVYEERDILLRSLIHCSRFRGIERLLAEENHNYTDFQYESLLQEHLQLREEIRNLIRALDETEIFDVHGMIGELKRMLAGGGEVH